MARWEYRMISADGWWWQELSSPPPCTHQTKRRHPWITDGGGHQHCRECGLQRRADPKTTADFDYWIAGQWLPLRILPPCPYQPLLDDPPPELAAAEA